MPTQLEISLVMLDGGTQTRERLDFETIADYARGMLAGEQFPPIVVFYDGSHYWLADGFHRCRAALDAGLKTIEADVKQGTKRDAILYSVGSNSTHGLRRTNADKRRAVMRLLEDEEWGQWSDKEIARRCNVTQPFVSKLRGDFHTYNNYKYENDRKFTHPKTGLPAVMNTSNIGNGKNLSDPKLFEYELPYQELFDPADNSDRTLTLAGQELWEEEQVTMDSTDRVIIIDPYIADIPTIKKVIQILEGYCAKKCESGE